MKKGLFTLLALAFFAANAFGQAYMSERLLNEISKAEAKGTPVKALVMLKDQADIQKLDADLYAMKASLEYRAYTVITTLQKKADETQGSVMNLLAAKRTTEVLNYKSFWIVNMIAVEAVPSVLYELSRHADIGSMDIDAALKYDEPVKRGPAKKFSPGGAEPGLKAINAHLMWAAGFTGAGYIVMNDDTGVQFNHPALFPRWRGNFASRTQAWFDSGSPSAADPTDCDGHGTHTMGTMTGLDPATNDTVGVAFGAQWIASKGICSSPHASNSIGAWQWAMNPDSNAGTITDMPVAIGNSWYDPDYNAPLECSTDPAVNPYYNAIVSVEASGIAIVFSAGNSGPAAQSCTAPKNMMVDLTTPFTTGAVNANTSWPYTIASFSSRGPSKCTPASGPDSLRLKLKPEICAPGEGVRSSYPTNSYSSLDGTSMACPHVVGALTLLRQAHPGLTGKQLKMALYETARDLGTPGEDDTYGMGMIDVWAAHLSLADPTDPKPVTNAALYSDYSTPTSMMITWTDPTEFENGSLLDTFVIDIYRNSSLVGTAPKGAEHYVESGLTNHQLVQYDLFVRHIGTDSLSSKVTTGTWHAGGHPTPKAPTALDVTGNTTSAMLTWTNPTENLDGTPINDLAYIRIYRDGVQIDSVAATGNTYTDIIYTLDGAFYTYKVQAVDNETPVNVSGFSNEDQVYVGPVPEISVNPDSLFYSVITNEIDTAFYYIHNTGGDTLKISGIEAEEITTAEFVPKWTQEQKFTPEYPKGAKEPTFGRVTEAKGGPDPFGNKWIDSDEPGGPTFNWYDISSIGTALTFSNVDDGYADVTIPFAFKYYGSTYTQARVRTNGWIGFDMASTLTSYSNAAIPASATPNLAIYPFWDDMDLGDGGTVYYYYDAGNNRFIIQYHGVVHYGGGGTYTYQILLYPSGKIVYQYLTMSGTLNSATIGIENSTGAMGLQCVYNANYVHDNLAIVFQKGVDWLSQSPTTGDIAPGDSLQIMAIVNAAGKLGGDYYAKAMINHNIPLTATYEHPILKLNVTGVPDIGVAPTSINYGTPYITVPDTESFTVTNTGTDVLHVTNMTTSTSTFSVVAPTSFDLAAGENRVVKVRFYTIYTGSYADSVIITSDGASGEKKVYLSAVAIDRPEITVTPDSSYFDLLTNEIDSATFTIQNTGLGNLIISSIEAEEITMTEFVPKWTQEQKFTPDYPKGAVEPTFGEQTEGSGGPDPFGYKWKDSDAPGGPVYVWNDITGTGTLASTWTPTGTLSAKDEGYSGPYNLGFNFKFYGQTYSQIWINANGFLSFTQPTASSITNAAIPASAFPNGYVAAFWDDLDGSSAGTVHYKQIGNKFVVQFTGWPKYGSTGGPLTFQMVLNSGGKVEFYYNTMSGTINSATVGIENATGTIGTQVAYNQTYIKNNFAVVIEKGVDWLSFATITDTLGTSESVDVKYYVNSAGKLGGDYRAHFMISSNDPDYPVKANPVANLHVTGVEDITVTPTLLDFGTNFSNVPDTMNITVGNNGTDVLTVTGLSLKLSSTEYAIITATPFDVPINGSQAVMVVFEAATASTFVDTVQIASSDVDEPVVEVALTGTTINPPIIALSDTTLSMTLGFEVNIDSSEFVIYNDGYSDLTYEISEKENIFTVLKKGKLNNVPVRHPVVMASVGNTGEVTSVKTAPLAGRAPEALWDLQFQYDAGTVTGAQGNAAALYIPTLGEFWTSRWASAILHRWNADGTLIQEFSVAGVTGVRSLTFDGTSVYAGINTAVIQVIDPNTRTATGTISTTGAGNVRFITYDPVRDGFWVGNFTGNIFCVNRSGAVIATITTTLAGKYGAAYDGFSAGGPYLWVWDQGAGTAGSPQFLHQFDLNTLTATGVTYDVAAVVGSGIAGGLFVTDGLVPGKATIGGMLQGDPINDQLWGLELESLGLLWADASPVSGTIVPNDSNIVKVYWHRTEPGDYNGYLKIESNDPATPTNWVHLNLTTVIGVDNGTDLTPNNYALHQNYPNPFNPTTTIKYDLKDAGKVTLKVYNILGQEVRTLVNTNEMAGFKSVVWDGKDNSGKAVSSGLYIYRLETGKFAKSHKMMLLK